MTGRTPAAPLWIYAIVFLSGAAVLGYEIIGARLLSPVFGSTLTVWSCVFAVTLLSLAAGYAAGGAASARVDPLRAMAVSLTGAGLFLTAILWLRDPLLLRAMRWGVLGGTLGAAALLLAAPLACLAAVGPFALKRLAGDPSRVGRDTGRVSGISTAGSVVGALFVGYWLVGRLDAPLSAAILAGLVCALAAASWAGSGRRGVAAAVLMACVAVSGPAALASRDRKDYGKVLERADSFYGALRVHEHDSWGKRILYIDGVANTVVDRETLDSVSDYIFGIELAMFLRPKGDIRSALLIGLGGGSLVGRLDRHYGVPVDVVEIDPVVVRLAKKWFGFRETGSLSVEDARTFLAREGRGYDLIIGDAFSGDRHPAHLYTVEAFRTMKSRLNSQGVFALNAIGYAKGPKAGMKRAIARTLKEVFTNVRAFPANQGVDPDRDPVNMIFFASDGPVEFTRDPLSARRDLSWFYRSIRSRTLDLEAGEGELITDARNPVDRLNTPVFVDIRSTIFKSRGRLLLD
ncbi:MAG: hypothetical protein AUJ52_01455 [Elusimicrobia bacterium CG1_02_63_36]|nr:MAG: hypothetical protein AUJ52_01455 [Elusimicrobia bacterium CG1_02_63_36]PIP84220.1 MAG: hypothetical protein COR54_05305 [Elusimicrobia bacterium CG22_combo_CG10-13_8_21_14_all_63_91]PJA17115.1 MAG: hypothetical protein COX66_05480 [Elusimicrobia bacterium CG_4_10_14_0_2_um_filter_63_34]PJB26626.1 MAG: hypothetical protein CO113_02365 [Elusimicrobia bacterium CG_4_9_14_3_um_filter_62_55]